MRRAVSLSLARHRLLHPWGAEDAWISRHRQRLLQTARLSFKIAGQYNLLRKIWHQSEDSKLVGGVVSAAGYVQGSLMEISPSTLPHNAEELSRRNFPNHFVDTRIICDYICGCLKI